VSLVVVLGGTRSGKSAVAERLAAEAAGAADRAVTYVATGEVTDPDMAERVRLHRARRPQRWTTVEVAAGPALPAVLAGCDGVVLVDSVGTWVARHHDFVVDAGALVDALVARSAPTVLVAEEVGLAVHPPTGLGRRFVDVVGSVNQAVVAVADRAVLVVAGRIVEL
jgi:adenosyl cobinamide kinase/adenosyl cobinamide phosphate guanylyltransferase